MTEIASTHQDRFDLDRQVVAQGYGKPVASMVFVGGYAYNLSWTQELRQIFGIDMLLITTASTYLGTTPEYVRNLVASLPAEVKAYMGTPGFSVTAGTGQSVDVPPRSLVRIR